MILAVDTNVLLDILIPNSDYLKASLECLMTTKGSDLIVCDIVFAELAAQFPTFKGLEKFIKDADIRCTPANDQTLWAAGKAWKIYAGRRKKGPACSVCGADFNLACTRCGTPLNIRQHIIGDFLIGAHAKNQADGLITRDRGFYRSYFKGLKVIEPSIRQDEQD
jgi:predicted nucleic acid-binding protein